MHFKSNGFFSEGLLNTLKVSPHRMKKYQNTFISNHNKAHNK